MSPDPSARLVVVLAVPAPDPPPLAEVSRHRLEATLLSDAVDNAESLRAARIAVLCEPVHVDEVTEAAAFDTDVWCSSSPSVREAADRASAAGARHAVVVASDAPQLPALLVGKLFRPLGRCDVTVGRDPRGTVAGIGLRLPVPDWTGDVDLDDPHGLDALVRRAPRRALIRTTPGWRRLREPSDFAELEASPAGAELTRALLARHR